MFVNGSEQNVQSLGPSIDAFYQVSVHIVEGFQRRRLKCEKLTDDRRQVMAKAHIAFGKLKMVTLLPVWLALFTIERSIVVTIISDC